jgi:hypothetical protein
MACSGYKNKKYLSYLFVGSPWHFVSFDTNVASSGLGSGYTFQML